MTTANSTEADDDDPGPHTHIYVGVDDHDECDVCGRWRPTEQFDDQTHDASSDTAHVHAFADGRCACGVLACSRCGRVPLQSGETHEALDVCEACDRQVLADVDMRAVRDALVDAGHPSGPLSKRARSLMAERDSLREVLKASDGDRLALVAANYTLQGQLNSMRLVKPEEPDAGDRDKRQAKVSDWVLAAFGRDQATGIEQRGIRLLEEAIEAYQAAGGSQHMAHELVDFMPGSAQQDRP